MKKSFLMSLAVLAVAAFASAGAIAAPPDVLPQAVQLQASTPVATERAPAALAIVITSTEIKAYAVRELGAMSPRARPLGLQYAAGDFGHVGKLCCQRVDQELASPRPYRMRT